MVSPTAAEVVWQLHLVQVSMGEICQLDALIGDGVPIALGSVVIGMRQHLLALLDVKVWACSTFGACNAHHQAVSEPHLVRLILAKRISISQLLEEKFAVHMLQDAAILLSCL